MHTFHLTSKLPTYSNYSAWTKKGLHCNPHPSLTSVSAIIFLASLHNSSVFFPYMGFCITTLTDPGYNLLSIPVGIIFPVPIRVMGTTGTPHFEAILNAPF